MPAPFNVGAAFNTATEWVVGNRLIGRIVGNPIISSALVTAVAAVIVLSLCKSVDKKKLGRSLLYMYGAVLGLTYLHHYVVVRRAHADAMRDNVREVFGGLATAGGVGPLAAPSPTAAALPLAAPVAVAPVVATADFAEVRINAAPTRPRRA